MNCSQCGHRDHGGGPCITCAEHGTTCWQRIQITGGDGSENATGQIEMASGMEPQPCMMCRHWEAVDVKRVVNHFLSKGLEPRADGKFVTPIVKDFPGRKSLTLDPTNYGFCRKTLIPTDMQATCEEWSPTRTLSELQGRLRR